MKNEGSIIGSVKIKQPILLGTLLLILVISIVFIFETFFPSLSFVQNIPIDYLVGGACFLTCVASIILTKDE